MLLEAKPYLKQIELERDDHINFSEYPFSTPAISNLDTLDFHADVTFFVGENGTGKSTLLEAIAVAFGLNAEGGTVSSSFSTKDTHSELGNKLKIIKSFQRPKKSFFLRAESFYNLATLMSTMPIEYQTSYGEIPLHEQSHGESFMATLLNKFKANGLYLMDEPEAALSPSRQMSAVSAIHQLVEKGSQFIIATHSPILLAYPNAKIYQFSQDEIKEVTYEETEHFSITRDFLNRHQEMMEILMDE